MKTEFYSSEKRNLSRYLISIYCLFFLWFLIVIKLKNPEDINSFDYISATTLIFCSFYPLFPLRTQKAILLFLLLFFNPLLDNIFSSLPFIFKIIIYLIIFVFLIKSQLKFKAKYVLFFNLIYLSFIYSYNCINSRNTTIHENRNVIELTAISEIKKQHNVDILIIDAYPDFKLLIDSFQYKSKLKETLMANDFVVQKPNISSTRTPYSIANLIYGKNLNDSFILNYNSRKFYLKNIIQNSKLILTATQNNFSFQNNTLLNYQFDNTIWKSYWPDFDYFYLGLFNKFPALVDRCKQINQVGITKDLFQNSLTSNIEVIDKYNQKVLQSANNIKNGKYLNVYHLLTLHKYNPENPRNAFDIDIKEADKIGCEIINTLLNKHKSTIIVCSDHGNRTIIKNPENQKKGILAIRKLP